MSDTLLDLLRRARREELIPLAEALGVRHEGLRLKTLARALDRRLRLAGANELANIVLRRGEGPPYADVLKGLGRRLGVEVPAEPELAEAALARQQLTAHWEELPEAEREALWTRLRLEGPAPPTGHEALQRSARSGLRTASMAAAMTVGRLTPLGGCLLLFTLARPRDERVLPAVLEVHRLRHLVRHRVTLGIVGSPSSGKDAAARALFGIDTGNVDPVAGSTRSVEILRVPGSEHLWLVNTPGLGDVVEEVSEEARQVLDHIDLFLYLVNAQGGVQAREKADYDACRATGRPTLAVVNKIDTLRPDDRERYLADAREKLGAPPEDFLAAAFDPLPQLAEAPIGVDAVLGWLRAHLVDMGRDPEELQAFTAPPAA